MTDSVRHDVLGTLLPGFPGPDAPDWVLDALREGLGGVCLFGSNVESAGQLRDLTATLRAANAEAVIAIDEEGGDVTRLFHRVGAPYPGNAVLGRIDDLDATRATGRAVGEALAAAGCTLTFAPDADVNSNPLNPVIGVRSFGTDPQAVARHVAAWTEGLQSTGISACAKHFPGHGDTATDSHLALPVVDVPLSTLESRDLVPFDAAIAARTHAVMTSHIVVPQLDAEHPATMSPTVLGMLRNEFGFDGVIVSDALDMHGASGVIGIPEAAVRALIAGCDLLCIGSETTESAFNDVVDAVVAAVGAGRLERTAIARASARVRGLRARGLAELARHSALATHWHDALPTRQRVIETFDISAGVPEALTAGIGTVVRIETEANIAVGESPWGPFTLQAAEYSWLAGARSFDVSAAATELLALPGPLLVVGKSLHRWPFATAAIDQLRERRDDVVVVDMGWPGDDRRYADIATFGASKLVGEALADLLEQWGANHG
ncbi:MAG TPA: glycoside hydrolase family 3 N-terminal domain-containing protein [Candidatus Lumbricidophila sp.]|nr:glycoside hydrolase family 3 N-terminal domain-containing protein [Candidatus Lumbricidophila sp.]